MTVPTVFRTIGRELVNYDWTTIAAGTGIQTFYFASTATSFPTLTGYFLSETAVYSDVVESTSGAFTVTAWTKITTRTFDLAPFT